MKKKDDGLRSASKKAERIKANMDSIRSWFPFGAKADRKRRMRDRYERALEKVRNIQWKAGKDGGSEGEKQGSG